MCEISFRGTKTWKANGVPHREDGPAVEYDNGVRMWFRHGQRHRDDGPAIEAVDGTKVWYRHDQLHREDGPAIEIADGPKKWYLNNQELTKPEWLCEPLEDRPLTTRQRELLLTLSENWDGTPELLYTVVTRLHGQ